MITNNEEIIITSERELRVSTLWREFDENEFLKILFNTFRGCRRC